MQAHILEHNKRAWNHQVESGNRWTVPVLPQEIAQARAGRWQVLLTPTIPVPRSWFPPIAGLDLLCLASGGGQQAPIFAAAGANVTVLDNSSQQLTQDRLVADREGLCIRTVEGDMADLSLFADQSFDLIFHPVSNCFVPAVRPVWQEAYRVLRPGGALLAGFCNPIQYIFDWELEQQNILQVRHPIPYSDLESLDENERRQLQEEGRPLEFGHSLDDQIGGQIDAGFIIGGFYEDLDPADALSAYLSHFVATRAPKRPI